MDAGSLLQSSGSMNAMDRIPDSGNWFYYLCNIEQFSFVASPKMCEFGGLIAGEVHAWAMSEVTQ